MTEQELIEKAYEALERSRQRPAAEQIQRMIDIGFHQRGCVPRLLGLVSADRIDVWNL